MVDLGPRRYAYLLALIGSDPIGNIALLSKNFNLEGEISNFEQGREKIKLVMNITLHTDGACLGNPGFGGYAAILQHKAHYKELQGGFKHTTNNRMELLGVIVGLETIKKMKQQIVVYSDSRYVVDAVTKGWLVNWIRKNFKGKKNVDLWKRFWRVYQHHQVSFRWIKGHAGHPLNERCDKLAVEVAHKGPWEIDHAYVS